MKVLLTGVKGQLGKTISLLKPNNLNLIEISRKELDLENPRKCFELILSYKPDWVINAAAYTAVDLAEKQIEKAYRINAEAPRQFSKALASYGGKLLHISTDFVFDGQKKNPYLPSDKTNPINIYGKSKSAGEEAIQQELSSSNQYTIVRTSWLMSNFGKNFALTILKLIKERENISVVNDQFGSPTSCKSLAQTCWEIINYKNNQISHELPNILHWSNLGKASWYDVASYILDTSKKLDFKCDCEKITPISSSDYKTEAKRPFNSVLDSSLISELLKVNNLSWQSAINSILKEYATSYN